MGEPEKLTASSQRVQQALAASGLAVRVVELPRSTRTAQEAAAAIGCSVEQIAKSLVFRRHDNGEPVLVIASGTNRVDERLLAEHLQAKIVKGDADFVRAATGFAIGGVPPNAVFSLAPRELVRATNARVLTVSSPRG